MKLVAKNKFEQIKLDTHNWNLNNRSFDLTSRRCADCGVVIYLKTNTLYGVYASTFYGVYASCGNIMMEQIM